MKALRKNIGVVLVAALGILGGWSFSASTKTTKLAPAVLRFTQAAPRSDSDFPILVILKAQADLSKAETLPTKLEKNKYVYDQLRQTALTTQGSLTQWMDTKNISYHRFYIMNMISVENVTPDLVSEIAARPEVGYIAANPTVQTQYLPVTLTPFNLRETGGVEPGITSTGAEQVWNDFKIKGAGITIAGQDSGVQWDHPALKGHYRGWNGLTADHRYNWHDAIHKGFTPGTNPCGFDTKAPCDDGQHGTHTMGTMVGDDGNTNQIGMAPEAKWMACRNMDRGAGRPTSYLECYEFFLAPYPQGADAMKDGAPSLSPDVVNNSWSCPASEGCSGDQMSPALKALGSAGIVIVTSAGNEGPACSTINTPAAYFTGLSIRVAAHDHRTGRIARFSSRGPSSYDGGLGPDVSAPGVSIRSAVPGDGYQDGWSGTSMAGPHVVGEVALLLSANKQLIGHVQEVVTIIEKTAIPTSAPLGENCGSVSGTANPNNTFGYGRIDAYKAVSSQRP